MKYDFDKVIDRKGTLSLKLERCNALFGTTDISPLWVADMDFACADFFIEAFQKRQQHGIYGYPVIPESLYDAIISWFKVKHNWSIERDWIVLCNGTVQALNFCVELFTQKDDGVLVQSPVYPPFFSAATSLGRLLHINELSFANKHYEIDFADLMLKASASKAFVFCNPHNPVGRVWKEEELLKIADTMLRNNVLIISDDIHADIVYKPYKYIPIASLSPEISKKTITVVSPNKTFNTAGLSIAALIVEDKDTRLKIKKFIDTFQLSPANIVSIIAIEQAYTKGDEWLNALLQYLDGNRQLIISSLQNHPVIQAIEPEATFLSWLKFKSIDLDDAGIKKRLVEEAKLGLSEGRSFGNGGSGFQRINFGCPRSVLENALSNLKRVF